VKIESAASRHGKRLFQQNRPVADLQDWSYERAESARKLSFRYGRGERAVRRAYLGY
jgi:hypothetical protein